MTDFSVACNSRLIDFIELKKLVAYSRTHIWRLEQLGLFPRRIQLSPGRVAWMLSEILQWIECKSQQRVLEGARGLESAHG
jgi:prophage regulatory protein